MKKVLKYVGIIIALSVLGFLTQKYFLNLSLSQLDKLNNPITSRSISGAFFSHLIFALSLGAIPILYLIVERLVKLKFAYQGLITCLIIIGTGIVGWQFRIFQINSRLRKMATYDIGDETYLDFNIQDLKFGTYLLIGFIIGTAFSILIFWNKNKKNTL